MIPAALARTAVRTVTVRTNFTPDVEVNPFAETPGPGPAGEPGTQVSATGGGAGGLILGIIKPAVYVETPAGVVPIEPWGRPDNTAAVVTAVAFTGVALGVGYLAWRGLRAILGR